MYIALPKPQSHSVFKHAVCGSGGPAATLVGSGFIGALDLCGMLSELETFGGVSGGSIGALLQRAGYKSADIIRFLMKCPFDRLFPQKNKPTTVLTDLVLGEIRHDETVRLGWHDTTPLGEAMEALVKEWPKGFWVLGSCGDKYYKFTAEAVYEVAPGQDPHVIHKGPAPVGIGIRITCTIPMFMHPVTWKDRLFQDGCFTPYGRCPTAIAKHFGAVEENIVACVPQAPHGFKDHLLLKFGKHLAGNHQEEMPPSGTVVEPEVPQMPRRLQMALTTATKEAAVLSGFNATIGKLHQAGRIDSAKYKRLEEIGSAYCNLAEALGITDEPLPCLEALAHLTSTNEEGADDEAA